MRIFNTYCLDYMQITHLFDKSLKNYRNRQFFCHKAHSFTIHTLLQNTQILAISNVALDCYEKIISSRPTSLLERQCRYAADPRVEGLNQVNLVSSSVVAVGASRVCAIVLVLSKSLIR